MPVAIIIVVLLLSPPCLSCSFLPPPPPSSIIARAHALHPCPALVVIAVIVAVTTNDQYDIAAQTYPALKGRRRLCTLVVLAHLHRH